MAASTQGSLTPLVRSWLSIIARRASPNAAPESAAPEGGVDARLSVKFIESNPSCAAGCAAHIHEWPRQRRGAMLLGQANRLAKRFDRRVMTLAL
jgi:hypothetical protein